MNFAPGGCKKFNIVYLSKWETGSGSPDISNLPVLAEAFGISVDELLGGKLNEPKLDTDTYKDDSLRKELTPRQKMKISIVTLAASIGAILGILAYNFGWLGKSVLFHGA